MFFYLTNLIGSFGRRKNDSNYRDVAPSFTQISSSTSSSSSSSSSIYLYTIENYSRADVVVLWLNIKML